MLAVTVVAAIHFPNGNNARNFVIELLFETEWSASNMARLAHAALYPEKTTGRGMVSHHGFTRTNFFPGHERGYLRE